MRVFFVSGVKLPDNLSAWDYFFGLRIQPTIRRHILPQRATYYQPLFGNGNCVLSVGDLNGILNEQEDILWLHRQVLPENFAGDYVLLQYNQELYVWKRMEWHDLRKIDSRLGRGILFKYCHNAPHPGQDTPVFELDLGNEGGNQIGGFNPLVLCLDSATPIAGYLKKWLELFLNSQYLLDIIPEIEDKDFPRACLHQRFCQSLPPDSENWSQVDRLIATSHWDRKETPFLILDALEGVFCLPIPESKDPMLWQAPTGMTDAWLHDWLIDWCCQQLGLTRSEPSQALDVSPLPRHPFHSQRRAFLRNHRAFHVTHRSRWMDLMDKELWPLLPPWLEQRRQDQLIDPAEPEGSIEDLVQALFGPRSSIYARLPAAPDNLPEEDQAVWRKTLGYTVLDVINTNLFGELVWAAYLTGSPVAPPENPWPVHSDCWWNLFIASLFSRPRPMIEWATGGTGLIGEAQLGELVIGGSRSEPPAVDSILFDFLN